MSNPTPIPWKRGEFLVPIALTILFTPLLMVACRLVARNRVHFNEAIKTSAAATVGTFFLDVVLKFLVEPNSALFWSISSAIAFVAWTIAIAVILKFRSPAILVIAVIFTLLRIPLIILFKDYLLDSVLQRAGF